MKNKGRIDEAVEAGESAFWTEVATVLTDCKSRELDAGIASTLRKEMKWAIEEWVRINWREERPWVLEFGEEYAVPHEVEEMVAAGILQDISRHNDPCPRFSHPGEGVSVVLRVLHCDPAQRNCDAGAAARFGVYIQSSNSNEDSASTQTADEHIYDGDNLQTAIAAVNAAIVARDPLARHVARIYGDLTLSVNIAAIVEQEILAGCTDEHIAETLSNDSGLNGEQMSDIIRLGRSWDIFRMYGSPSSS